MTSSPTTMIPLLIFLSCILTTMGFAPSPTHSTLTHHSSLHHYPQTTVRKANGITSRNSCHHRLTATPLFMTSEVEQDPNETVARRIVVTGDVNGGYYRTCVINEVCIIIIYLRHHVICCLQCNFMPKNLHGFKCDSPPF